jgi:zinc transporter ZupT
VPQVIENFPRHFEVVGNSFAGGTLLATAVFFLLYESTHLIPINDSQEEAMASAKWGCMILLGFLVSSIVDLGAHGVRIVTNKDECSVCEQPNKDVESIKNVEPELSFSARQFHILSSVLVGDWLHNFCDGIFIGTAFVTCGHSMGWSVTAATAFHELAQVRRTNPAEFHTSRSETFVNSN